VETVISKTNNLNAKSGPFDITLYIGDVLTDLSDDSIPKVEVQHPIFFTSGFTQISPLTSGNRSICPREVRENLKFLGNYGIYQFANGIKLAFVAGDETMLSDDLENIKSQLENKEVDILLSFQWPKTIAKENKLFLGNSKIDELVRLIRPKYHFAAGSEAGKFLERAPFQWTDGTITRFISLAKFGSKEKWIYAFNYDSNAQNTKIDVPKNLTSNPFEVLETSSQSSTPADLYDATSVEDSNKKRKAEHAITSHGQGPEQHLTKRSTPATRRVVLPENCFFCLSNPKLQTHMIISIGEHAYLTIAKGPLTKPTEKMKFSGHCLIIPIAHIPKLEAVGESSTEPSSRLLLNEIMRYEVSLVKMFASFNLGTVLFQINKSNSVHFHIQVFPIPIDFLSDFGKNLDKNTKLNNTKFTQNVKLNFKQFENDADEEYNNFINSNKDYISFTVFNKSILHKTIYIAEVETLEKPLDLQFGRRVLAFLLQSPKRLKWDKCQQSVQKETSETESFKESFKEYDFTMDP